MDKKEIQSFSLSRLLEDHELRPGDLYYDGCLIASRVDSQCDIHTDLFSYPVRMDAIALVFCSFPVSGARRPTRSGIFCGL